MLTLSKRFASTYSYSYYLRNELVEPQSLRFEYSCERTAKTWQYRRRDVFIEPQHRHRLETLIRRSIDFDRAIFRINDPVFFHTMLAIQLTFGNTVARNVLASRGENFYYNFGSSIQTFVPDDFITTRVTVKNKIGNHAAVLVQDQTGCGNNPANRVFVQVSQKTADNVSYDKLVWKSGTAGHKQFSFYRLVTIAVVGHRVEIINSYERFDSGGHLKLLVCYWEYYNKWTCTVRFSLSQPCDLQGVGKENFRT